jgi:2-dehydro-3-deoxy-D-arabinonate dehydratase
MSISFAHTAEGIIVRRPEGTFFVADSDGQLTPFALQQLRADEFFEICRSSSEPFDLTNETQLLPNVFPNVTPVLGAGVTFANSLRERRLETLRMGSQDSVSDDGRATPYDVVYDTNNPPEVFFKATAQGHIAAANEIWIRPDGAPDGGMGSSVPEPERVLLINRYGEIIAHTVGSDTTARQLESLSPLYLPAAKTYWGCTTLCQWFTLYDPDLEVSISMEILRGGVRMYRDEYSSTTMKRTPESLVRHARTLAPMPMGSFPQGFALFTGTGIIPPVEFSLQAGDRVIIDSPQLGRIDATTKVVEYNF